jgi:hypothetical protein
MFEAELVDSVSGERVAAIVRRGIGATEKNLVMSWILTM